MCRQIYNPNYLLKPMQNTNCSLEINKPKTKSIKSVENCKNADVPLYTITANRRHFVYSVLQCYGLSHGKMCFLSTTGVQDDNSNVCGSNVSTSH